MLIPAGFRHWLRPLAHKIYRSSFYDLLQRSQGDPRYLYLPLAWAIARILVPRRVVKIDGVRFTLPCDNWITHFRWYLFRNKEPEVRHFIDNYVRDGDVFFDIGANIGVFTLYACKRHKALNALCFEPEFSNLHYLKENVLKNGLADRVLIVSAAVSDVDGFSRLHIQDVMPGAAVHTESIKSIDTTDEGYRVVWREGVSARSLDSLCADLGIVPNAIKIDTDGNEAKILDGGAKTLREPALRCVVIELPLNLEMAQRCIVQLTDAGFKLSWSDPSTRNQIWARA